MQRIGMLGFIMICVGASFGWAQTTNWSAEIQSITSKAQTWAAQYSQGNGKHNMQSAEALQALADIQAEATALAEKAAKEAADKAKQGEEAAKLGAEATKLSEEVMAQVEEWLQEVKRMTEEAQKITQSIRTK